MGEVAIVAYRPKPGRENELLALTREHHPILRKEGLVTDRPPIITRAKDGTIVEVFEWVDGGPTAAHSNVAVAALWRRYEAVCEYVPLAKLAECNSPFAGFEALN